MKIHAALGTVLLSLSLAGAHATLGFLLLASSSSAQIADQPVSVIAASHGVSATRDGVIGGGPDYRARFEPGRFTFTPALGRRAPATMPISFTLEEIRRGGTTVLSADSSATPEVTGKRVTYHRAGDVEERYDVRADGVYQSFVFPTRPPGEGDLVVRGRIETELAARDAGSGDGRLLFELAGFGGVSYGDVVGIDAAGNELAGESRLVGDVLELSLPGSFVDAARFPLVFDPLFGATFDISAGPFDDRNPDVARSPGRSLVVWERAFSIFDVDVRARLLDSGGPIGSTIFVTTAPGLFSAVDPAVCYVRLADRFLLVWSELDAAGGATEYQVRAATVDSGGGISATITVSPSVNAQTNPAVGGDRSNFGNKATVVWEEEGVGIRARLVEVFSLGDPTTNGPPATVAANFFATHHEPAISRSAGATGHVLIVWRSVFVGSGQIHARLYDRGLDPLGVFGSFLVSGDSPVTNDSRPSVDGDGRRWVVAFQREEPGVPGKHDIAVRALSRELDSSLGNLFADTDVIDLEDDPGQDERTPAVSWVKNQALVAYIDDGPGLPDARAKSVDPVSCLPCESEFDLAVFGPTESNVAVASQYSGGSGSNGAIIVWQSRAPGAGQSDLRGVRYSTGHSVNDLGGDCGFAGNSIAPCAYSGNPNFTVHLQRSLPASPALLLFSPGDFPIGCGGCTLRPVLTGSVFAAVTDAEGDASITIPIPPGAGGAVGYSQWITFQPGGPCFIFPTARLSNALRTSVD